MLCRSRWKGRVKWGRWSVKSFWSIQLKSFTNEKVCLKFGICLPFTVCASQCLGIGISLYIHTLLLLLGVALAYCYWHCKVMRHKVWEGSKTNIKYMPLWRNHSGLLSVVFRFLWCSPSEWTNRGQLWTTATTFLFDFLLRWCIVSVVQPVLFKIQRCLRIQRNSLLRQS